MSNARLNHKIAVYENKVRVQKQWEEDAAREDSPGLVAFWRSSWEITWDRLYQLYRSRFMSSTGGYRDTTQ